MNNYSNTEKSLKRWLKTKVKVTMATVVGFLIAGNVVFGQQLVVNNGKPADDITETDFSLSFDNNEQSSGIFVANEGSSLNILSDNITVIRTGNKVETGHPQIEGIKAQDGGKINLGNENTKNINITSTTNKGWAIGLLSFKTGSEVTVNSENLKINVHSDEYYAYGINVQNNTTPETLSGKPAKMIINSENTEINVTSGIKDDNDHHAVGISVLSQGQLEINGNLEVKADSVLATRGNSVTKINENGKNTVKLDGDIEFNYDERTSKTTVDADVTLNLSNADSYLNGKISVTGNPPVDKLEVNSMKLGLSNGGTWNITGDSFVNELALDGGIINVLKTEEENTALSVANIATLAEGEKSKEYYQGKIDGITTLNIGKLSGNGGTVTVESNINDKKEISVQETNINISEITGDKKSNLEVGFSGINADDLTKNNNVKEAFEELQKQVAIKGDNGADISDKLDETYFAKEGQVTGEITAKDDGNGNLVITQAEESKTVMGLKDLATINYLSWKQEMGSLTQRMGELRDSSAEHGVWARVYGGKVENGSQYDNEYQTYQVGYDKKYSVDNGRVYLGYLVSYTDGETDYDLGHGENYSVGAGIYATWMNNNGHYVDVLYKVSRLNNKFDVASSNTEVGKSHGDYDTYGISLSAEYGKRFDITEKWFAEPSIGMHLGRLGEETYTTDSGIEVSQDSIYTAEGRIGTAVGYKFNDKGNVYARTHVVKEFAGDVDAEYTANGATSNTSEDMDDTWLEFGVGVNYRFAENVNVYADIEKSGDATVDTEWQGNLGFRYEF